MAELPPGYEHFLPLFSDELGVTYGPGQAGGDTALRLLNLTVPNRVTRRQFRASCLAATPLAGQPGVLGLHEAEFTADHHPYLITDLPAGTLAARLAEGPLPVPAAAGIARSLASTLTAAHDAGVLHLDLRPGNVIRTGRGTVPLLAHFGVSRAVSAAGGGEPGTECLAYAGRELFGWDTPGRPADIYGLGATLYAMLAGQAPYAAEARLGRAALYQRVLRGGPPPIPRPGIAAGLTELIAAMMDPDPGSRPDPAEVVSGLASHAPAEASLTRDWGMPGMPAEARPEPAALAVVTPAQILATRKMAPSPPPAQPPEPRPQPAQPSQPPEPEPAQAAGRPKGRPVGPMLLVAAGVIALLAGFVWGIVTGSHHNQPQTGPTVRATASASQVPPAQLALYQARNIRVSPGPGGELVTWAAPARLSDVTAYVVIAELNGAAAMEHPAGLSQHRIVFAGLAAGHRYCFVVGTLIESGNQASTAAAKPVCANIG